MRKAFTIAELMVAVAIMAVAIAAMGWVFKISIDAQRMSTATSEIARSYRAITDQLNNDFAGLRQDCGVFTGFWLYKDSVQVGGPKTIEVRADGIAFFANGNFQTVRQYGKDPNDPDVRTISGNEAKIYYGFSATPYPAIKNVADINDIQNFGCNNDRANQVVLRIQTLYTTEAGLPDPCDFVPVGFAKDSFPKEFNRGVSLMTWQKTIRNRSESWFDSKAGELTARPKIDMGKLTPETAPYVLCGGVANFAVKYDDGFDPNGVMTWWPENKDFKAGGKTVEPKKYKDRYRMVKFEFTLCSKTKINGLPLRKSFSHIIDLRDE